MAVAPTVSQTQIPPLVAEATGDGTELSRGGPVKEIEPSGAGERNFERSPVAPNFLASVRRPRSSSARGRSTASARCPRSHGTFQRDEASKRTEDQIWSRIPVTGFEWEVAYRAGRRGADMNGAFGWIPCDRISTLQTFEKGRGDRSDRSRGTKRGGTTIRFASSVDGVVDTGDPGHQGRSRTLADRPNRPRHVRRVCRPSIPGDRRSRPELQGRNDQTSLGALDQDHLCQRRRRASGDRRPRDLLPDGRGCARPDPVRECRR